MKIIAVMTQKGGVGKTMTASSLAYILGVEHGKRVLIADADQQGNISMLYGSRPRDSSGEGRRVRDRGDREHGGAVGRPARIQSRHQDETAHDDASEEHDKSSG